MQKPRGRERQREETGRKAARVKSGSNMAGMRNHTGQALVSLPLCQMKRKSTKDLANIDTDRVAFVVLLCFFFFVYLSTVGLQHCVNFFCTAK